MCDTLIASSFSSREEDSRVVVSNCWVMSFICEA